MIYDWPVTSVRSVHYSRRYERHENVHVAVSSLYYQHMNGDCASGRVYDKDGELIFDFYGDDNIISVFDNTNWDEWDLHESQHILEDDSNINYFTPSEKEHISYALEQWFEYGNISWDEKDKIMKIVDKYTKKMMGKE